MYRLSIYTSRNTNRKFHREFPTLTEARNAAKVFCKINVFETGDFHGNPIQKGKIAIESGEYPDTKFELWEYIVGHDSKPIRTEWNN